MTPDIYNIPAQVHGDTYDGVQFTITSTVDNVTSPVDLTDATIKIQFRKCGLSTVVKTLTIGNGIVVTDAAAGEFSITAMQMNFGWGVFDYDIQITFASGVVKTYVKGTLTVVKDTTQ